MQGSETIGDEQDGTPSVLGVLGAQMSALRERIGDFDCSLVELAWQAADTITVLASIAGREGTVPSRLGDTAALCAALERVASTEAQRMDLSRQMSECIAAALLRLDQDAQGFSCAELARLYVSHEQRAIHDRALGIAQP